ncbi:major capsid protein [Stenotrophomonas sp. LC732]|jgi:hypothetical protein|uniref:major capsid protein n=1 Tax=unclassified Stenotrophomonas TaxID=196198 RepID=UPI00044AF954|nr:MULTISPECIES: hypothetical protein [unclassified Stenotrophomonas]EKT4104500.1 hypothetical protein [Stenotrophomonas maltophilia]KDE89338.1 hypothetical protein DF40_004880 [Stenotrophomonas maltophilia M30]KKF89878.1 hypothetical protein XY58_02235 [Stenotrophomonas maltophilia]MBA0453168.1 hypothetical protein [Stenotrophomonas maltophilia]MBA0455715.1 hypothetical protein [Stenotrophomonas maltophilia]
MSAQMTPGQVRVVDPILSEHARGYRQAQLVASVLFPFADVAAYGGRVIEFGKESFKVYNSKRAPGAATKRVRFGYEGKPYSIIPSSLEAVVPREHMRDANAVPGINLATRAVNVVLRSQLLEYEVECAGIATNASNYDNDHKVTLTGTDVWSNDASDPASDVETGKEAVRASIGLYPNTMLLSATAFSKLKRHPKIIARSADSGIRKVTLDLLRQVFEIENIVVGAGVVAGANDEFGDVWGTSVVLAYVSPGSDVNANAEEPSYGYGYRIEGMPLVEEPYYDKNAKSWIYGVSNDASPVLAGMAAGYLIQGAGL